MGHARRQEETVIVCGTGIQLKHTVVVVHRAVRRNKLVLHTMPCDHLCSRTPHLAQIWALGSDHRRELVNGLAEETIVVLVGEGASVEGGITSEEDLNPVVANKEWADCAIVD
jgi:hypothetical protein